MSARHYGVDIAAPVARVWGCMLDPLGYRDWTRAFCEGNPPPLPKQTMRLCSRKRPTMDLTRMFSDRPFTPGRNPQMPRTTMLIFTPALDAA